MGKFAVSVNGTFIEEITNASSGENAIEQFKSRNTVRPNDVITAEEIAERESHL
jgi:hypothetical protein